jgi:hypothetical protein
MTPVLRLRWLPCLLVSLLLTTFSVSATERSGVLKNIEGDVKIIRDGKSLIALPGAALLEGDRIVTGRNSAAAATLRDGTVVSAGPNASLDVTHFIYDEKTQNGSLLLNLIQGTMRLVTGIMGKTNPELVKVTTPTSVVGVRGTDFIVEVAP